MLNRLKLVRNSFVRSGKEKKSSEIVIAHSEFDHNVLRQKKKGESNNFISSAKEWKERGIGLPSRILFGTNLFRSLWAWRAVVVSVYKMCVLNILV